MISCIHIMHAILFPGVCAVLSFEYGIFGTLAAKNMVEAFHSNCHPSLFVFKLILHWENDVLLFKPHIQCNMILKFHLLFFTRSGNSLTFSHFLPECCRIMGWFFLVLFFFPSVLVSLSFTPLTFCEDISIFCIKRRLKCQTKCIKPIFNKHVLLRK